MTTDCPECGEPMLGRGKRCTACGWPLCAQDVAHEQAPERMFSLRTRLLRDIAQEWGPAVTGVVRLLLEELAEIRCLTKSGPVYSNGACSNGVGTCAHEPGRVPQRR